MGRHRRVSALAATAVAAALSVSACSSSSSAARSAGQGTAAGSPLKIGIITDVGTAVNYANALAAARGAVRAVNAAGGVNGHPLQLSFCNEDLNPNNAEQCANKMAHSGVMAMVGDTVYTAEATVDKIFDRAGIAQVGNWGSGISESDPNSYLFFGGQNYANAAQLYAATKYVGSKIGYVRLDLPYTAPYTAWTRKAAASSGAQVVATTVVASNSVTDFSPYASTLLSGHPQVVLPDLGPVMAGVLTSMDQLGWDGKVVQQDSNFSLQEMQQLGTAANQLILTAPFPPPSASAEFPGLRTFLKDMQAEKAAGDADAPTSTEYAGTPVMDAFLSVIAVSEIAAKALATTAAQFKQAIDTAKDVSLLGLTPPWTPNVSLSKLYPRTSLDSWYFYTWVNGTTKLLNSKPASVSSVVNSGYGEG